MEVRLDIGKFLEEILLGYWTNVLNKISPGLPDSNILAKAGCILLLLV